MKYFILATFVLFLSGCDYKKVEEGDAKAAPAMKCAPGKCGAAMQSKEKKDAPAMKCAPGKCGSSMK